MKPRRNPRDGYAPLRDRVDVIRLVPGEYETPRLDHASQDFARDCDGRPLSERQPFFQYVLHRDTRRDLEAICSAGPLGRFRRKRALCYGCEWHWLARARSNEPPTI